MKPLVDQATGAELPAQVSPHSDKDANTSCPSASGNTAVVLHNCSDWSIHKTWLDRLQWDRQAEWTGYNMCTENARTKKLNQEQFAQNFAYYDTQRMIIETSPTTVLPSNVTVCVRHSVLVCCGCRRAALLSVCASAWCCFSAICFIYCWSFDLSCLVLFPFYVNWSEEMRRKAFAFIWFWWLKQQNKHRWLVTANQPQEN